MPTKKKPSSTPITSHKHTDKRANISTEELRDFIADYEKPCQTNADRAEYLKEGGGVSATHRRSSKPGTRLF